MRDGGITTFITNPGIAARIEEDVVSFERYGFRFQPPGTLHYAPISSGVRFGSVIESDRVNDVGDYQVDCSGGTPVSPPCHLWVGVPAPSFVPTVGPYLRTLVRITEGIDPTALRVTVDLDWDSAPRTVAGCRDLDGASDHHSPERIAHHVHMLVRNSMGAALFLTSLSVLLPRGATADQVRGVMARNKHVNYPSVQLLERGIGQHAIALEGEIRPSDEGRSVPPIAVETYLGEDNRSARISIRSRMCTVRLTPVLYHLARALRGEIDLTNKVALVPSDSQQPLPLFLACVDKPANLYRILMLTRDYRVGHRLVVVVRDVKMRSSLSFETKRFLDGLGVCCDEEGGRPRVETIDDTVGLLELKSDTAVVAVDLHSEALTLDGDAALIEPDPALQLIRQAGAVIWGFEKDGIPSRLDEVSVGYVQVVCRSSLNLVAAMSTVMHRAWARQDFTS